MSILSEDHSFFSFDHGMDISEFFSTPGDELMLSGTAFQSDVGLQMCAEESGAEVTSSGGGEGESPSATGSTEGDENGWSKDDTIRLTELVKFYGPNWDEVAKSFEGQTHTPEDCHQQYQVLIDLVTKQNQLQLLETADESEPTGSPTPSDYMFSSTGDGSIDPYFMQSLDDGEVHVMEMGTMAEFNPAGVHHHVHHPGLLDMASACAGASLAQVIEMNPLSAHVSMGITMEVCQPMNPIQHHHHPMQPHPALHHQPHRLPESMPPKTPAEMAASMTSVIVAPRKKNVKKPTTKKPLSSASSTVGDSDKAARKAQRRAERAKRREERRKRREKKEKNKSKKERKEDQEDKKDKDTNKDKKDKKKKKDKKEKREKKNQRRVDKMTFTTIMELGPPKPSAKKRKELSPSGQNGQPEMREIKKAKKSTAMTAKISTMKLTKVKSEPGEADSLCVPPSIVAAAAAAANAACLAGAKAHAQLSAQAFSPPMTPMSPTPPPSATTNFAPARVPTGPAPSSSAMGSRMLYPMIIPRFQHSILPAGMSPNLLSLPMAVASAGAALQPTMSASSPCSPTVTPASAPNTAVPAPVPPTTSTAVPAIPTTPSQTAEQHVTVPTNAEALGTPSAPVSEQPATVSATVAPPSTASVATEQKAASPVSELCYGQSTSATTEPPAAPALPIVPAPSSASVPATPATNGSCPSSTGQPSETPSSAAPSVAPSSVATPVLTPISPKMIPRAPLSLPPGLLNPALAPYSIGVLPRINSVMSQPTSTAGATSPAAAGIKRKKTKEDSPTMGSANPGLSPDGTDKNGSPKKRKRRTAAEIERKFKCEMPNCSKSYGSEGALKMHIKLKHPGVKQPALKTPSNSPTSSGRLNTPQSLPLLLQFPLPFMPGMVTMGSQPIFPAPTPGSAAAAMMAAAAAAATNGSSVPLPANTVVSAQPAAASTAAAVKSPVINATAPGSVTSVLLATPASAVPASSPLPVPASSTASPSPTVSTHLMSSISVLASPTSSAAGQTAGTAAPALPMVPSAQQATPTVQPAVSISPAPAVPALQFVPATVPGSFASATSTASSGSPSVSSSELAVLSPRSATSSSETATAEVEACLDKLESSSTSQDEFTPIDLQIPSSPLSRSASDLILNTIGDTMLSLPSAMLMDDAAITQLEQLPEDKPDSTRDAPNCDLPPLDASISSTSSDVEAASLLLLGSSLETDQKENTACYPHELSIHPLPMLDLNLPSLGYEEELPCTAHPDLVPSQAPISPAVSHDAETL